MLSATFTFVLIVVAVFFSAQQRQQVFVSAGKILRAAAIGDFGRATCPPKYQEQYHNKTGEEPVASMIKTKSPFFGLDDPEFIVITLGDNNYGDGTWETIDENIGQYYADFITPYNGNYTKSPSAAPERGNQEQNRFFPSLGNREYFYSDTAYRSRECYPCPEPYRRYFNGSLPPFASSAPNTGGVLNGRYYDFVRGPVHFFAINSNVQEPDGHTQDSVQAAWLKRALAASTSPHRVCYMHHPCYSNDAKNGPTPYICWPFHEWGCSVVLSGHAHAYQKFVTYAAGDRNKDSPFYHIGNGLGGTFIYGSIDRSRFAPETLVFYNGTWGALYLEADDDVMNITFYSVDGEYVDVTRILKRVFNPNGINNTSSTISVPSTSHGDGKMGAGIAIGAGVSVGAFALGYVIMSLLQKKRRSVNDVDVVDDNSYRQATA